VENWIKENKQNLKKIGIKKISHAFERAWYYYKENNKF